jgi:hypothetical protein
MFDDWFKDTFIPGLNVRRDPFGYPGQVYSIVDNCPAHRGSEFDHPCAVHGIVSLWLPPDSSDQLQMLDLCIFALTTPQFSRLNKVDKVNVKSDHIVRILDGFVAAAVLYNIVMNFRMRAYPCYSLGYLSPTHGGANAWGEEEDDGDRKYRGFRGRHAQEIAKWSGRG